MPVDAVPEFEQLIVLLMPVSKLLLVSLPCYLTYSTAKQTQRQIYS